ncbi:MAG: hypothetical protein HUU55_07715 [Myxococcales bacterium]|nr:hypothetical protein [Myxococcales bacterium]
MRNTLGLHIVAALFAFACTAQSPTAAGQEAAADKKETTFVIDTQPAEAKVGDKSTLKVTIKPGTGYKWNENFPAAFKIVTEAPKSVVFQRRDFDKTAFQTEAKQATLSVPFDATAANEETIDATATFSVCNDETCLIYRNEKVAMKVKVR